LKLVEFMAIHPTEANVAYFPHAFYRLNRKPTIAT
jgi:hypothetical protein